MARSTVKLEWHGDRVMHELKADLNAKLATVGELITSQMRRNLSTPGPEPSAPGEFPHAQSRRLRHAPTYEADPGNTSISIIVPVDYAGFLEAGSSRMQARPFIMRTIDELRPKIVSIMTKPRRSLFA